MMPPRIQVSLLSLFISVTASAAEVTQVTSLGDPGDAYDFNVRVQYQRHAASGALKREYLGRIDSAVELVDELKFSHVQNILSLRAEAAVFWDLQLHFELPIIVSDSRSLSFSQNDACGSPPETNCVTKNNSTLVRDGLIDGRQLTATQIDIANATGGAGMLTLPTRAGIDQFFLGLTGAILNQQRQALWPTWVVGFEARIGVGGDMAYDPKSPAANTAVGRGLHQLHFYTSISRRYRYIDPWVSIGFLFSIPKSGSLYDQTTFVGSGQEREGAPHRGGIEAGFEVVPWEEKEKQHRLSFAFKGRMDANFEGRGYSPMWELLANNPRLQGPCDLDPTAPIGGIHPWNNGTYCNNRSDTIPYPGITRQENYLEFSGGLAAIFQYTKWIKSQLGFNFGYAQEHLVTFADAGRALQAGGRLYPKDYKQVNPMYRPLIDLPGRRFRQADTFLFDVILSLTGMF